MNTSDISFFQEHQPIHLMGAGGAGMRGLFQILSSRGLNVDGCDRDEKKVQELDTKNLQTYPGHDPDHLHGNQPTKLLIHSEAIPETHPELRRARERKISTLQYGKALSKLFNKQTGIAVCGTHGKTTCTALVSRILENAGLDPTCLVGGTVQRWDSNARYGNGSFFVAEACEFSGNFSSMEPDHILLTNIESDHMDYFQEKQNIHKEFGSFLEKQSGDGVLIWNRTNATSEKVVRDYSQGRAIGVSSEQFGNVPPALPGPHQYVNSALVAELCRNLGVEEHTIRSTIQSFRGIKRRFEVKVKMNQVIFIDDYGHHPTEIQKTLEGVRQRYPAHSVIACFQPHQYSRTKHFLQEWSDAFEQADEVWLVPIYAAREDRESWGNISISDLERTFPEKGINTRSFPDLKQASETLKNEHSQWNKTVFITIGAGDVWKILPTKKETPT